METRTQEMEPVDVEPRDRVTMKTAVEELGIAGGEAMFREIIHVGRPNIGDRQRLWQRINDLLDRRWLTNNGLYVQEFERQIADRIGRGIASRCRTARWGSRSRSAPST